MENFQENTENQAYAPPSSNLDVNDTNQYELASRWTRLFASIIDLMIILPVVVLVMFFIVGFDHLTSGDELSFVSELLSGLIVLISLVIINGKILVRDGQTWGKKFLAIKIVTDSNDAVDTTSLVKRQGFTWLVPYIPIIGQAISLIDTLFIFNKQKRCIHDMVGNTKVVKLP